MGKPTKRKQDGESNNHGRSTKTADRAADAAAESAATSEEALPEATSAATDSSSKRARTAKAAAAAAAGFSSSVPSPASRCYPDHLSPALSFLDTKDFGCALRVSKRWHSIGRLNSAWPAIDIAALTAGPLHSGMGSVVMMQRGYTSPRVFIDVFHGTAGNEFWKDRPTNGAVAALVASALWAPQTRHLQLQGGWDNDTSKELEAAAKLPNLTSLALNAFHVTEDAAKAAFSAMAPRLVALSAYQGRLRPCGRFLPLLVNLRSLSFHGAITADMLSSLSQMEYLHLHAPVRDNVEVVPISDAVYGAIRRLSVEHKLRSFKLSGQPGASSETFKRSMQPLVDPELQDGVKKAALTSVTSFSGTIDPWLLALTSLTHLTVGIDRYSAPSQRTNLSPAPGQADSSRVSSSIVHFRVDDELERSDVWPPTLGEHLPSVESIVTNQRLQYIRSDLSWFGNLRSLEASCGGDWLSAKQLKALAGLAQFRTLKLVMRQSHTMPPLSLADLRVLSRSPSWRTLIFVASTMEYGGLGSYALKPDEISGLRDFRVHVHYAHASRPQCRVYALTPLAAGGNKHIWRSTDERPCCCDL